MKKNFNEVEIEIVEIKNEDVICASPTAVPSFFGDDDFMNM